MDARSAVHGFATAQAPEGRAARRVRAGAPAATGIAIRAGVRCHCPLDAHVALIACTAGSLALSLVGGPSISLAAGDACLLPARSQYCVEARAADAGCEVTVSAAALIDRHGEVLACSPALASFVTGAGEEAPLVFRGLVDGGVACALSSIVEPAWGAGPAAPDALALASADCALRQLAIALARGAREAARVAVEPLSLEAVTAYLSEHLETATLDGTARHFCYHPNTVARFIKRASGKTFCELVTELRMERAAELVAGSSIPVQRIAEACGYRNMTHFYDLFRRLFDCTPGEYRAALAA